MKDEEILKIFERNGLKIELGAPFSVKGQIAQLLNGARAIERSLILTVPNRLLKRDGRTPSESEIIAAGVKFVMDTSFGGE